VENWSFWLDLRILGMTIVKVVKGRGSASLATPQRKNSWAARLRRPIEQLV
jgi:hypothetical protein